MKSKHLLLLSLLLSQTAPVWGMDQSDEHLFSVHCSAKKGNVEILDKIQGLQQSLAHVDSAINSMPAELLEGEKVMLLGMTGSGKSTLMNFLMGKKLMIGEEGRLDTIDPIIGSEPGHEMTVSKTVLPSLHVGPTNTILCDCPGFGDLGGPEQDIINAYAIHRLFSGPSKILLAVSETALTERVGEFLNLMNNLTKMVSSDQLEQNLALVITKQGRVRGVNAHKKLKEILSTTSEKKTYALTEEVRRVLQKLTNEEDIHKRVPYFPYPNNDSGEYDFPEAREKILDSISSLQSIQNPKVNLFVRDDAKLLVTQYAQQLNDKIADLISTKGLRKTVELCNTQIDTNVNNAKGLRANLSQVETYLSNLQNGLLGLSALSEDRVKNHLDVLFAPQGMTFFPTKKLKGMIETISFLKRIDNTISYETNSWAHGFETLISKIQQLTKTPEIEVNQNTLTLKGLILGTSDVVDALQHHQQTPINTINVFGLNTLFIDQDLTCPSVSLNLLAPIWRVLPNKTINLSGFAGASGANGINPGEDGQPGKPGNNGGNLYGKGVNFVNINQLTLNLNGGSGGAGGNGKKGKDGKNGHDGDLTVKKQRGNYTYYEDQGTDGQDGQNGGCGGAGGIGGPKGSSVIDGLNAWNSTAADGTAGTCGNAAAGGAGGVHGRHCQGTYETGRTTQESYTNWVPRKTVKSYEAQEPYEYRESKWETLEREDPDEARRISDYADSPLSVYILDWKMYRECLQTHYKTVIRYKTVTRYEEVPIQVAETAWRTVFLPDSGMSNRVIKLLADRPLMVIQEMG